jgi:hypothetical protein
MNSARSARIPARKFSQSMDGPGTLNRMRLLLYNIRYGPASEPRCIGDSRIKIRWAIAATQKSPTSSRLKTLHRRARGGRHRSIRTRNINQAEAIGRALGQYSVYQCKYGIASSISGYRYCASKATRFSRRRAFWGAFPLLREGIKRLIIELELEDCAVFLVHLSLKYRQRQLLPA